jgi:hypothetical protein
MLNPLCAKVVAGLVVDGLLPERPDVVEIGNQTYAVGRGMLESILGDLERLPEDRRRAVDFAVLRALPDAEKAETVTKLREKGEGLEAVLGREKADGPSLTERFYRGLGFASYAAIDLNSRYGSLIMDLNKDFVRDYGFDRRFALVTNNGTSEHVADQAMVLRNIHAVTAVGGLMVHLLPFTGFLNHGFFNYQPGLFEDLASANGYGLLRLGMADRDGAWRDPLKPDDVNVHFYRYLDLAMPSEKFGSFIVAVMRKTKDAPFALPVQGKYLADIEQEGFKGEYAHQAYRARPTKGLFFEEKDGRSATFRFRAKRNAYIP